MYTIMRPSDVAFNNDYERVIPDGFTVESFNEALDAIHGKYFELKDGNVWMVYYVTDDNRLQVCAEDINGVEVGFTYEYFMSAIVKEETQLTF